MGGGHSLALVIGGAFASGSDWGGCHSLAVVNGGGSFASASDWGGHSLAVVIGGVIRKLYNPFNYDKYS